MRPRWFRLLTEAAVGLGEFDEAAETVRLAAAAAERLGGMPWRDGEAHSARATLALARGEPGHAVSAARRALDRYTAARTPADVARARLQLGQALAAAGDPNAARRELRVALAEFGRCGADGWADRVAGELRGLGERLSSRRGPVRTDAILTRREGEVAKRIARGYTNRQIARELFISEKTVEAHVTRMFAKLGVNSRVLLAVELRRLHEL
jgi:DNA-binding CsgD family transcriptional regulator